MIYFIKPCVLDGPIKIGHAKCKDGTAQRLLALNNASPWPLEVICIVPGTLIDESWLHQCFAPFHSHREWFHSHPALRHCIEKIAAAGTLDVVRPILVKTGSIHGVQRRTRERIGSAFIAKLQNDAFIKPEPAENT